MSNISIDPERLLKRLAMLGEVGRDDEGRLTRLTGTDADKAGRDLFVRWLREAGLEVEVDQIGNIFGVWRLPHQAHNACPVLVGSHIDTVVDAGIYDGAYGVLAGLEVIETLKEADVLVARPLAVAAFTNEEGVRYAPAMVGSLVYAGGRELSSALETQATDGTLLRDELERIGYLGTREPGFLMPHAYVEIHIEQGPVLEHEAIAIGAVHAIPAVRWQRVTIEGAANHAGTTPMTLRHDAGLAAARAIAFIADCAAASPPAVATVGSVRFEPDTVNVIPGKAMFTIDLRAPDEDLLSDIEHEIEVYLDGIANQHGLKIERQGLVRFPSVEFAPAIVDVIEKAASSRELSVKRMVSGAGHDAQMIARMAPAAMIFVPSKGGISHSPAEYTPDSDLVAGANVLLDVVTALADS